MRSPLLINFNLLVINIDIFFVEAFRDQDGAFQFPAIHRFLTVRIVYDSLMLALYLSIPFLKGDFVDLPPPSLTVVGFGKALLHPGENCSPRVPVSAAACLPFGSWKLCCVFSWESQHQQQRQQHLGQP